MPIISVWVLIAKRKYNHMNTTNQLSFFLIDLMKSYINKEEQLSEKASEIILQIGKETDRRKINNESTKELEYLYDTAIWLKGEISK